MRVFTPLAHIDLVLRVDGCRVERLADVRPRMDVQLREAIPVRLALPADVKLPEPPLFLGAALDADDGWLLTDSILFDARGELLCRVPEPGRMKVLWYLERRHEGGSNRGGLDIPSGSFVVVHDQDTEQRIELSITNEELQAALAGR